MGDTLSYTLPTITPEEIRLFRKYIYKICGIELGRDKGYLLENRFFGILKELECASFTDLHNLSRNNSSKVLEKRLIDAITTHETSFFRDNALFELLKQKIIPDLTAYRYQGKQDGSLPIPLSIWSAACSTGQEIYSIAIVLKELFEELGNYRIRLLGSDISEDSIQQANAGQYNGFEMNRGLSQNRIARFFRKEGDCWTVKDDVKSLVSFQCMNLMDSFQQLGKFDIIFCRNLAVYFPQDDRRKFFKRMATSMHSHGYLVVGSTESLSDLHDIFIGTQHMGASYYQLRPQSDTTPARKH